jgi:DNA recombination protein RmuC
LVTSLTDRLDEATARADRVAAERHQQDLAHAMDTLLTVAGERLESRARAGATDLARREEVADAELRRVGTTLAEVAGLVQRLERERADQLGRVSEQLQGVTRTHAELAATTGALRETLASSQARGQWGERMAEDVLTAAGLKRGVNYLTQQTLPSGRAAGRHLPAPRRPAAAHGREVPARALPRDGGGHLRPRAGGGQARLPA